MMKKFSLTVIAAILMANGCDQKSQDATHDKMTSEDVRRDAEPASETNAHDSRQTKEEFEKALDDRLKVLEVEISRLRENGHGFKDQAKVTWDQKMVELEVKRDAAIAKLAEVGRSSAEAWKVVQEGAQSAWTEMDKALHEAAKEF